MIDAVTEAASRWIATTNLTLEELQHPQDNAPRPYLDRLISMRPRPLHGQQLPKGNRTGKAERLEQLDEAAKA